MRFKWDMQVWWGAPWLAHGEGRANGSGYTGMTMLLLQSSTVSPGSYFRELIDKPHILWRNLSWEHSLQEYDKHWRGGGEVLRECMRRAPTQPKRISEDFSEGMLVWVMKGNEGEIGGGTSRQWTQHVQEVRARKKGTPKTPSSSIWIKSRDMVGGIGRATIHQLPH